MKMIRWVFKKFIKYFTERYKDLLAQQDVLSYKRPQRASIIKSHEGTFRPQKQLKAVTLRSFCPPHQHIHACLLVDLP